jgi:dTDP-4-dehydrorhamnose 3,5-epimerase
MTFNDTEIGGVRTFQIPRFCDERGTFQKLFHAPAFEKNGFGAAVREEFVTVSQKDVLRGMHFQLPPAEHAKYVVCLAGKILDVVLDVRAGSPTFGKFAVFELGTGLGSVFGLALPTGIAHGFLALTDNAVVHYQTTHEHAPALDSGIRWNSFGFRWPVTNPIISTKDQNLPTLDDFRSLSPAPFPYEK